LPRSSRGTAPTNPMTPQSILLAELDGALRDGAAARGPAMLRRIASLFLDDGASYTAEQVELFDEVLSRLADGIEATVRAELAARLCEARVAPPRLLRRLALDERLEVAAPLLCRLDRLDDAVLVECVDTRGQGHLLAISRRRSVSAAVTDRLVARGEMAVLISVVGNPGSRFSESGFAALVRRAEGNDALAAGVGIRADLPRHHFLRLLSMASDVVRTRLEAVDPQNARDIRAVVAQVAETIAARMAPVARDFTDALARVHALKNAGTLGDREILHFLVEKKLEEAMAAVALLADLDVAEVDQALQQRRPEALLTILKAVGLGWPTAKAFLQAHAGENQLPPGESDRALASFARLGQETARQALQLKRRPASSGAHRADVHNRQ